MVTELVRVRPEISLVAILAYAFIAFLIGVLLTPAYVRFLKKNKIGKQLRIETVDGRSASIFRHFHEKKFGTPTMGGILIWTAITVTILLTRYFAYLGIVSNSLLQRGQVYLPLFMLLSLGILGAIDDYLNVTGSQEAQWKKWLPLIRGYFFTMTAVVVFLGAFILMSGKAQTLLRPDQNFFSPFLYFLVYILALAYVGSMTVVLDVWSKRNASGPSKKGGIGVFPKIASLSVISLIGALWFYYKLDYNTVQIPFSGPWHLGLWYIPVFMFIIVASANAVNITDGLDGLAGGLLAVAFCAFGVLAYVKGLYVLAGFCGVTAGAVAAFLWHNVPPALFFMGDTGALALGGTLGVISLMIDQVFVLPLVGFVFVIETLSVIIQLLSKRLRNGKKVFIAAPIHHHFEAKGWGESKVTMRLWIIGAFFSFLGIVVGIFG